MNSSSGVRISKALDELPVGIISFNADGIIDFVNPAFLKMGIIYSLKTPSLISLNIFENGIIPGVLLDNEFVKLKEGYPFEKEIKNLKAADGSSISLILKCAPYFESNRFAGGIMVLEDLNIIAEAREEELLRFESLRKIAEGIADFFFVIDNEGAIKYSAGKKLSLIQFNNIKNLNELIPNLPGNFKEILKDIQSGIEKRFSVRLNLKNEFTFYECIISSLLSEGTSKYLSCAFINISDKKKSEELDNRLNLFRSAADIISDGIIGINGEGIINSWSPSVQSLTGFSEAEAIGKTLWDFIPALTQQNFYLLKEDLRQVFFIKRELSIQDYQKNEIIVEASFFPGEEGILIILKREIKEQQYNFKSPAENFISFVTITEEVIIKLNDIGTIEYVNPAFASNLNIREGEAVEKNLNDFTDTGNKLNFDLLKEKSSVKEIILLNNRKERVYFISCITPVYNGDFFSGFNLYLINISEKKKEEKDLQLFKDFFENSKEGMALEKEGRITEANTTFAKLFGYDSGDELIGKDILDLAAPNDVLKAAEYFQLYKSMKEVPPKFELAGKKKDGTIFSSEFSISSFKAEETQYLILITRNITERKKAQRVIRESEEKYRNLIENIDDFLYTLEKGRLFFEPVFYTGAVKKITGYTSEELMGSIKMLLKLIHPDDLAAVNEKLMHLLKSSTKASAEQEFRIINKQGNVVWVRNKITVARDEKGEAEKIYGLVSDISLRKKTEDELQRSTQNLVKLNETKDRFISIISHDLRTPFSSILGFTDLILNDETLQEEERNQYVRYIQESSNAMLSLVNSLLDWTRLQTGRIRFEPERVEATEIILKSINTLAGAALQKNIKLSSAVPENIFVYADLNLAGQVFNNLISNAIKFTNAGGSITITASPSEHMRFYKFTVSDTGIGIKPGDAKNLFGVDTKFTTEGTAGEKGTGLGLSLVKEIIEKHGGTIYVESEPGKGSNFIFTLPVAAANILIVDPNTTDRILYSKILKHITPDYIIDTATNGFDALRKISESTYALVITENKMPEMGGYKLALELKKSEMKVKPPVIVLSNFVDRHTTDDYNEIGVKHVFQKPVDLSILKQAIEKSLHEGIK